MVAGKNTAKTPQKLVLGKSPQSCQVPVVSQVIELEKIEINDKIIRIRTKY
ncbi:hypothetical protein CWATWH0402_3702 [Crocosphaera watsonii WH 0402]|uniref:Uncharacterized protein n=1 Tax=Crocosphaera watsonii WH 0402 TaxID=1284629 RepID=T2JNF8_CROWT|nr:hypothetical protein CWATWH0402_3702 [Crocosphaera watsonii WH 0402]